MPRRQNERPSKKITMYLVDADWQKLKRYYPRIGASAIVRDLLHKHLLAIEAGQKRVEINEGELNDTDRSGEADPRS